MVMDDLSAIQWVGAALNLSGTSVTVFGMSRTWRAYASPEDRFWPIGPFVAAPSRTRSRRRTATEVFAVCLQEGPRGGLLH
jgi:hypothetical protein